MNRKKILIIGGYGNTGYLMAKYLLAEHPDVQIVIAGRNTDKAASTCEKLNAEADSERVSYSHLDASNKDSLRENFGRVDFVVVASPTIQYTRNVAEACIEMRTDYLDVQLSTPHKLDVLRGLEGKMKEAGRIFITDGGFHPGIVSTLVRYGASKMDAIYHADVYSSIKLDWGSYNFSDASSVELVEELKDMDTTAYVDGAWVKLGFSKPRKFDFGGEVGVESCVPMYLNELKQLPEYYPTLKNTGFFVGGFNPVTDYFVMPLAMVMIKMFPGWAGKPMGKLFEWSVKKYSKPPYLTQIVLKADGMKDGVPVTAEVKVIHEDGYVLTAVPTVACLLQYLDGSISEPGLHFHANVMEPVRAFEDMKRMGIRIES